MNDLVSLENITYLTLNEGQTNILPYQRFDVQIKTLEKIQNEIKNGTYALKSPLRKLYSTVLAKIKRQEQKPLKELLGQQLGEIKHLRLALEHCASKLEINYSNVKEYLGNIYTMIGDCDLARRRIRPIIEKSGVDVKKKITNYGYGAKKNNTDSASKGVKEEYSLILDLLKYEEEKTKYSVQSARAITLKKERVYVTLWAFLLLNSLRNSRLMAEQSIAIERHLAKLRNSYDLLMTQNKLVTALYNTIEQQSNSFSGLNSLLFRAQEAETKITNRFSAFHDNALELSDIIEDINFINNEAESEREFLANVT